MKIAKLVLCTAVMAGGFAIPALAFSGGWAVVDASGTLVRGENILGSAKNGTGNYNVGFTHAVRKCAFTATVGDGTADLPAPGYVTVAGANANTAGVFVSVFNANGHPADAGFHLNVRC